MLFTVIEKARKLPPTLKHRPAIWECILGTVRAMNEQGETRYFDYDHASALEFAGYSPDRDPRWSKPNRAVNWTGDSVTNPQMHRKVLWIVKLQYVKGEAK